MKLNKTRKDLISQLEVMLNDPMFCDEIMSIRLENKIRAIAKEFELLQKESQLHHSPRNGNCTKVLSD